jgi:hypothetical protein
MRQDPIQPLVNIGRRVLQTVEYLATPPVPDRPLGSYENQLRDPVVALSSICEELLERLAPVAAEPETLPYEPGSRFVAAPNPGSTFPTFSRAGAAATRTPAERLDETADPRGENQVAERLDAPGLDDTSSPLEESLRKLDEPAPFPDETGSGEPREAVASREPGGGAPQTDGPVVDGSERYPAARQAARRATRSRNVQHPVKRFPAERSPTGEHPVGPDGESSPEGSGSKTWPPARQEWPETGQTELPSDARAPDISARAEDGPARGVGKPEAPFPLHGSRLTGSTERLAAMLRAQVAQPEPVTRTAGKESQEGENGFSRRQGDDESGASRIVDEPALTRPEGRAAVEEIMERLADELETEFVRTYGRSGG